MEQEPKQYELVTIKDIFDKIPADKIQQAMKELADSLYQAKVLEEMMQNAAKMMGLKEAPKASLLPERFTWIDDGKEEITTNLTNEDGETLITIKR